MAQQAAQGAAKKAVDYATDAMESLRANIDDQVKRQAEALKTAQSNKKFRRPGQIEDLMGRARYLWEKNDELKKKMATLERKQQELEGQQAQAAGKMQELLDRIKGLREEGARLQQQLEEARAPPPPVELEVQKTVSEDFTAVEAKAGQLQQDCERIREEREALANLARIAGH